MKISHIITGWLILTGLVITPFAWSDDDTGRYSRRGVAMVDNPLYKNECTSCHMGYPPGLLPEASWIKLMAGLEDHFGDNAELDAETHRIIKDYLVRNSADKSNYRRSQKFARGYSGNKILIRISELPYFVHEHDEIPTHMVKGNKDVRSFSHCNACHRKADQGSFREREIDIPGYGQWDD